MLRNTLHETATVSVDPRTDPLWQQLIAQTRSDIFHSPAWMRVLADSYDLDVQAIVLVDEGGRPRGGVPYVKVSDIFGERAIVLPFSDYCDPLVDSWDDWSETAEALLSQAPTLVIRCLHNERPLADKRFAVAKRARWHGMDLSPDIETHWQRIDSSARRAIRKAEKEGVQVRMATGEDDLRAFFNLHLGVRKHKYRMLAQPYRFFQNIWRHIIEQGTGFLLLAHLHDQIIGGVLFLEWKGTLYYKFNASSPAHLNHRPNDLIIWNAVQHAKAKNLSRLDFGLSDWDQEDLIRYKRKYASEEKTISFLRAGSEITNDRGTEVRQLLGKLTELLTRGEVPDSVTSEAGDLLYKYFL